MCPCGIRVWGGIDMVSGLVEEFGVGMCVGKELMSALVHCLMTASMMVLGLDRFSHLPP